MGTAFNGVAAKPVVHEEARETKTRMKRYELKDTRFPEAVGVIKVTVLEIPLREKRDDGASVFYKASAELVSNDTLLDGIHIDGINVFVGKTLSVSFPKDNYNQNGFMGGGILDMMLVSVEKGVRSIIEGREHPIYVVPNELKPSEVRALAFKQFEDAGDRLFTRLSRVKTIGEDLASVITKEMVRGAEHAYLSLRNKKNVLAHVIDESEE